MLPAQGQDAREPTGAVRSDDSRATAGDLPSGLTKGVSELGVWGGIAFGATTAFGGLSEEQARGRGSLIVAGRYGRVVATVRGLAIEYVLEVIPMEVAFHSLVGRRGSGMRGDVYGAGISPLGLTVGLKHGRVRPFVGFGGGLIAFTDAVPLPETRRLDFTADFSGGVSIPTRHRRAVLLGARFHHISNGGRASPNRGLNTFDFFGGVSVFR